MKPRRSAIHGVVRAPFLPVGGRVGSNVAAACARGEQIFGRFADLGVPA